MVQRMVPAQLSGVVFTRNPVTGLNETVIEGVPGLGEELVQRGATPCRWVQKWGQWLEQPADGARWAACADEVARTAQRIARKLDRPLDMEWAWDGHTLYWLQMRPITSLAKARVYSNSMAKEMVPGAIKPAVWSINIPMFSELKRRVLAEILGAHHLDATELVRSFYYHAYFDMNTIGNTLEAFGLPRDGHELMLGIEVPGADKPKFKPSMRTFMLIPRILVFAGRQFSLDRRLRKYLPELEARLEAFGSADLSAADEKAIQESIHAMRALMYEVEYHHILAYALLGLHQNTLKALLKRRGLDPARFDVSAEALGRYTPTAGLASLHRAYRALSPDDQALVANGDLAALSSSATAAPFVEAFQAFLRRFWHLRDRSADLSLPCWAETPELVLATIANQNDDAVPAIERPTFQEEGHTVAMVARRTQVYRVHRDALGFYYSWMSGLLRQRLLLLGDRLVRRGLLDTADDIFYLYMNEIEALTAAAEPTLDARALTKQRRDEMAAVEHVPLPSVIYGEAPALQPAECAALLKGLGTSTGAHTGRVRQVSSVRDLPRIGPGDVIVIPYSDVALTPLFARASAIVSCSGGMLSHSSIVAREFGIPCVVSVEGAEALQEGALVTVDGAAGQVVVLEQMELAA